MKKAKYDNRLDKRPVPERGGGTTNVEEPVGLSIEKMYKRMLLLGEIGTATKLKSNNHGSIERADLLINSAKAAPQYMKDGERYEIINKLADLNDKIKSDNKTRLEEDKINRRVNAKLKSEQDKLKEIKVMSNNNNGESNE